MRDKLRYESIQVVVGILWICELKRFVLKARDHVKRSAYCYWHGTAVVLLRMRACQHYHKMLWREDHVLYAWWLDITFSVVRWSFEVTEGHGKGWTKYSRTFKRRMKCVENKNGEVVGDEKDSGQEILKTNSLFVWPSFQETFTESYRVKKVSNRPISTSVPLHNPYFKTPELVKMCIGNYFSADMIKINKAGRRKLRFL